MSSVAYYSNNAWDNALLESVDLFSGRSTRLDEFFNTFGDDPTANFIRESLQFDLLCDTMNISKININEANEETKKSFGEHVKGLWKAFVEWVKGLWRKLVGIAKRVFNKITGFLGNIFGKLSAKLKGKDKIKIKVIDKEKAYELEKKLDAIDVDDLVEKLTTQARQRNAEAQEEMSESALLEEASPEELQKFTTTMRIFAYREYSVDAIKPNINMTVEESRNLCKKIQVKIDEIAKSAKNITYKYNTINITPRLVESAIKDLTKLSNELKKLHNYLIKNDIESIKLVSSQFGDDTVNTDKILNGEEIDDLAKTAKDAADRNQKDLDMYNDFDERRMRSNPYRTN